MSSHLRDNVEPWIFDTSSMLDTKKTISKHGAFFFVPNLLLHHRFFVRKDTVISSNSTAYAQYVVREVDRIVRVRV
jgi:hypothetical protein